MERTCLIAGPGYTGLRLARRLRPCWRVVALARSEATARRLDGESLQVLRADWDVETRPGPWTDAAQDASIAYLVPPPETGRADPRLARFLAALGAARPAAVLYLSTTGVYGDTGGGVVTEDSPVAPSTDRGHRRAAAERTVRQWCAGRDVRCVVLRVPGIYGPGRLPLDRLRRGEPALRPEDAGPGNRIHVDDLVTACVATLESAAHGVFNVSDGDHASTTGFLQRTAALAGLPPPPLVALADAPGRISPGMLSFLVESRRVDNRRMREELGVQLRYASLDAGIAASLSEMSAARG